MKMLLESIEPNKLDKRLVLAVILIHLLGLLTLVFIPESIIGEIAFWIMIPGQLPIAILSILGPTNLMAQFTPFWGAVSAIILLGIGTALSAWFYLHVLTFLTTRKKKK